MDRRGGRKGLGRGVLGHEGVSEGVGTGVSCERPEQPVFGQNGISKNAPNLRTTNPAPNILQSRPIEGEVFVFKVGGCHHKVYE